VYGDVDAGGFHGFLLDQGSYTTLDVPGATDFTVATGINDSGQIAGFSDAGAFLSENGNYAIIDVPGTPTGINNAGQIVGSYYDGTRTLGFLLALGSYTTLDPPGSVYTSASGINASGQIVGYYYQYSGAENNIRGFLLDQGSYTTLDVPGSTYTSASGINDVGQIVGYYHDASGTHGFLATPVP
jgi:uncharacterized membrane protein